MRHKLFICVSVAAAVVLLTAVVVGAINRRDRVPDITGYNVLSERMFSGIVASGGHVSEGLMYFALRTADSTVEVQIGPKDFVDHSGFKLKAGDIVTVIGMPVVMKDRQIVLAREVRSMNGILIVRDHLGLPLWEGNRPILMDPERWIRFSDQCNLIWEETRIAGGT
jgi:hypothetical protein